MNKTKILLFTLLTLFFNRFYSQELDNGHIPFYAVPYYSYKPLKVNVGKYNDQLETNDTTQLLNLSNQIKTNINNVNIETLFVLSIRLYDLGKKDEAFYWFQTAKTRARVFIDMLDPKKVGSIGSEAFELKQLFSTFSQLVGGYINGYGFNDIEKGANVLEVIKSEIKLIQSYKEVYKKIKFLPEANLEEVKQKTEKKLEESIIYFRANKDDLKKQRIEAGIQDKY